MSLPDDVLLLVGDFLDDHSDRYNLIFVCQRFHKLFLANVYRYASLRTCRHVLSFLKPTLKRPELARAVRTLRFNCWQDRTATGYVTITDEEKPILRNWVRRISLSDEEHAQWEEDLNNGVSEAWIALLLPLASNLRNLHLVYPQHSTHLDRTVRRAANKEYLALQALNGVSLGHLEDDTQDTKGVFLPSQILPFFEFPQMRTFSADSVIDSKLAQKTQDNEPIEFHGGMSSISEIKLTASNGAQGMTDLIASCSKLRSFKYQHSDVHLYSEGYRPSAFYSSLSAYKDTLTTLWLDNCGTHLPFTIIGANETHDEWFGSLADFTVLKDVRIQLPNLLDIRYQYEPSIPLPDILPKSIESLYIEGCKENSLSMLLSQIDMVVTKHESRFPTLKWLNIEGFFHEDEDYEDSGYESSADTGVKRIKRRVYEMFEPMQELCSRAGISLAVRDRLCLDTMQGSPM